MRLDLVVGPNGSGKTTFVRKVVFPTAPAGTAFVNADEIARERWPDDPEGRSYDAAQVAAATRRALIAAGRPFIAETVFSHSSKLELIADAHAAGLHVALHVLLVPEELTVLRVERRVASGGHSVPEKKIRDRYQRLWALVRKAMSACDTAVVYDSAPRDRPVVVARLANGIAIGDVRWPTWTPSELADAWPRTT